MDLYLAVMMGIFSDQSHQLHARMVRGEGLAYVPLETVTRIVNKLLPITDKVGPGRGRGARRLSTVCGI